MKTPTTKPTAFKKLENGDFAVQYDNLEKWWTIDKNDQAIAVFIVFYMLGKAKHLGSRDVL